MTSAAPTPNTNQISCLSRVLLSLVCGAAAPWIVAVVFSSGSAGFGGIFAILYTLPALVVATIGGLLGEVLGRALRPSRITAYVGLCLGAIIAGMTPIVAIFGVAELSLLRARSSFNITTTNADTSGLSWFLAAGVAVGVWYVLSRALATRAQASEEYTNGHLKLVQFGMRAAVIVAVFCVVIGLYYQVFRHLLSF